MGKFVRGADDSPPSNSNKTRFFENGWVCGFVTSKLSSLARRYQSSLIYDWLKEKITY